MSLIIKEEADTLAPFDAQTRCFNGIKFGERVELIINRTNLWGRASRGNGARYGRWALLFILFYFCASTYAESPANFNQAKKRAVLLFKEHSVTLYCGCQYKGKQINLNSCGMDEAKTNKRAQRLEWEHIMAAEHFGRQLACWRTPICTKKTGKPYKGRACCAHQDARFRHMESELYNLWPAVGVINQARSNYRFAMLPQQTSLLGCAIRIDKATRRVEPSTQAKGVVARAHLFMSEHYKLALSDSQRALFVAWNRRPGNLIGPNRWRLLRAMRIPTLPTTSRCAKPTNKDTLLL